VVRFQDSDALAVSLGMGPASVCQYSARQVGRYSTVTVQYSTGHAVHDRCTYNVEVCWRGPLCSNTVEWWGAGRGEPLPPLGAQFRMVPRVVYSKCRLSVLGLSAGLSVLGARPQGACIGHVGGESASGPKRVPAGREGCMQ